MEKDKHKIIFAHGKCISEDVLIAYANNTLTAKEKHVVEKHTLGCDMCADALEGIMLMKRPEQLKGIVESLNKRISGAGEERKPIILWMDTRVRVAIAAGLALLIGFFFLFNNSLNDSAENKTVSDNLKQKGEATDSVAGAKNLEESAKTDSTFNFQQQIATGKEQELDAKSKHLEKSGEVVDTRNVNNGPGWSNNAHASGNGAGGDKLKNSSAQNEFKKDEAAPMPPKDAQQQNREGFNDITLDDRSKSVDQKTPVQDGKFVDKDADKKKENRDDANMVSGKTTTVTTYESVTTVNTDKSAKYYSGNAKTDSPKKEEKEKIVSHDLRRKEKKKKTADAETQKSQPDEKSNKGGKDNLENVTAPQSTTVSGGTSGTVSPNMVPQNNKTEQEITLSKQNQLSDEEDAYTKPDTLKFRAAMMDSVSKTSELSGGEKKYEEKDFGGAVIVFSKTLETKPTDREALYKLGDSYLQLNKPDLAIVQFDKLILLGKGAYYDAARYDKSIALVKQNKNAEAKKLLMEIEQTSTEYKSRAKVELDQIK